MLVEAAANTDPTDGARPARSSDCVDVADVAVATDADRAARALWRYREGHPEAINLLGAPLKLDVSLPADMLAEFIHAVPGVREPRSHPTRRCGCSVTRATGTCTST